MRKPFFLLSAPPLNLGLAFHCAAPVRERLGIDKPDRPAVFRVSTALTMIMIMEPLLEVVGDAGVVGAVAATENV